MSFPYSLPKVTITNGTSLSPGVYLGAGEFVGVEMSAAWTTAPLTFQGSIDGTNFFNMVDGNGVEISVGAATALAGVHIAFGEETNAKTEHFRSAVYVKVRSGPSSAPVNQGADRILTLIVKKSLTGGLA